MKDMTTDEVLELMRLHQNGPSDAACILEIAADILEEQMSRLKREREMCHSIEKLQRENNELLQDNLNLNLTVEGLESTISPLRKSRAYFLQQALKNKAQVEGKDIIISLLHKKVKNLKKLVEDVVAYITDLRVNP